MCASLDTSATRRSFSIFISYRRSESEISARDLANKLHDAFPGHALFFDRDRDSIDQGQVFTAEMEHALRRAIVYVLIAGPRWMSEFQKRRETVDYMREEVRIALDEVERDGRKRICFALTEGAEWPINERLLPEEIRGLARVDWPHAHLAGKTDDFEAEFSHLLDEIEAPTGLQRAFAFRSYNNRPLYFPPSYDVAKPFGGPNTSETVRRAIGERHETGNFLVLTGARGSGKTQLALKYASERIQRERYAGIWVFRAKTRAHLNEDARRLCDLLGVSLGISEPFQRLSDWLENTSEKWLLVFDGLPKDEQLTLPTLQRRHHDVLVTSADRGSLVSWECLQLSPWSPAEAIAWLCERWPGLPAASARSFADACECFPPFLELCARRGRDRTYPLPQLLKDLKRFGAARILVGAERREKIDLTNESAQVCDKGIDERVLRFLRIVSHFGGCRLSISDFVFCEEAVCRLFPELTAVGMPAKPAIQDKLLAPAIATGIVDMCTASAIADRNGGCVDAIRILQAFADQILWGAGAERAKLFGDACKWLELAIAQMLTSAADDEDNAGSSRLDKLLGSGLPEAANAAVDCDVRHDVTPSPWIEYANAVYLLEQARIPAVALTKFESLLATPDAGACDTKLLRLVRRGFISACIQTEQPDRALATCKMLLDEENDSHTWKDINVCVQLVGRLGDAEGARLLQGALLARLRDVPAQRQSAWELVPGYIATLVACSRLREAKRIALQTLEEIAATGGEGASTRRIVESIEFNLANVSRKLGDYKAALHYDSRVVDHRRSRLGREDHPDVALAIISKAATELASGWLNRSTLAAVETGYTTLAQSYPSSHSDVKHALEILQAYRQLFVSIDKEGKPS